MSLGLAVTLPDGTIRKAVYTNGVLTATIVAVNTPERAYAEISLRGRNPESGESRAWVNERLVVGSELRLRVEELDSGDEPSATWKAEPVTVAAGIEDAKERTKKKIAELQAELAALEGWNPDAH